MENAAIVTLQIIEVDLLYIHYMSRFVVRLQIGWLRGWHRLNLKQQLNKFALLKYIRDALPEDDENVENAMILKIIQGDLHACI